MKDADFALKLARKYEDSEIVKNLVAQLKASRVEIGMMKSEIDELKDTHKKKVDKLQIKILLLEKNTRTYKKLIGKLGNELGEYRKQFGELS